MEETAEAAGEGDQRRAAAEDRGMEILEALDLGQDRFTNKCCS